MDDDRSADLPLAHDDRFSVELARFLDGRADPSTRATPPGNPPIDVLAALRAQEQLDSIVG